MLKAAVEVVAEQGVAGVTHRAVTERAGVPLATVSYYFSSIGELISEALQAFARERAEEMAAFPAEPGDQPPTPVEVAGWFTDRFLDVPVLQRLAFFEILVSSARSPELAGPAHEALHAYQQAARAALSSLGAAEDEGRSRAFTALGLGYGLLRLADPEAEDSVRFFAAVRDLFVGQELSRDEPDEVARRIGDEG